MSYIAVYLAVAVPLADIDAIWLKLMSQRFYLATMGEMARSKPNLWPAIVFYMLYPVGLVLLTVMPAQEAASGSKAGIFRLLFGFFTPPLTISPTRRPCATGP